MPAGTGAFPEWGQPRRIMPDRDEMDKTTAPVQSEIRHPLRFHSLAIDFLTNSPPLSRALTPMYGHLFQVDGLARQADTRYHLVANTTPKGTTYHLLRDDKHLYTTGRPRDLLSLVESNISQAVIHHFRDLLILHAGAVAQDGVGVIIGGEPGMGKSTLVAGLVHAGFGYLSDEIVLLCPRTLRLIGFPKVITFKKAPAALLAPLLGAVRMVGVEHGTDAEGLCAHPVSVRIASSVSLDLVLLADPIVPGPPVMAPISRARGIARLLGHAANLRSLQFAPLGALAEALREGACYSLNSGALDRTVARVRELVATTAEARAAQGAL